MKDKDSAAFSFKDLLGRLARDFDEDDDDTEYDGKKKKRIKSGLYAKSDEDVAVKQNWPHMKLKSIFSDSVTGFKQLSLAKFVAGEMEIIGACTSVTEKEARIEFLTALMYKAAKVDFRFVLKWYAAWVRSIEQGEKKWGEDFYKVGHDIMMNATPLKTQDTPASGTKERNRSPSPESGGKADKEWFCSGYNRNKCSKSSPHKQKIKGVLREVMHVCATCYLENKGKKNHPECSSACPLFGGNHDE